MRQTSINTWIQSQWKQRKHKSNNNTKAIQLNTNIGYTILFNIFIERSNNERLFVQINIIIMQLKRMTTHTQITCTIGWEQMVKGMTSRANLCKELIIWTVNQIFSGHKTVYVTKLLRAFSHWRLHSRQLEIALRRLRKASIFIF